MIKVTNDNTFDFIAKHNGIEYAFPYGTSVYVEDDAAVHIFGLGKSDKSSVLARHGWAGPTKTYADGMAIMNKFSFDAVQRTLDAPLASEIMEAVHKEGAKNLLELPNDRIAVYYKRVSDKLAEAKKKVATT